MSLIMGNQSFYRMCLGSMAAYPLNPIKKPASEADPKAGLITKTLDGKTMSYLPIK